MKKDFPNLKIKVNNKPLIYFDNAATTLKPFSVINSIKNHYESETSNVHRGIHHLSEVATKRFEDARVNIQKFLNANSSKEIIFTKGTTNSINLLSSSLNLRRGDIVLVSEMEHHSNIVPWQLLRKRVGIIIKKIPIDLNGKIVLKDYKKLLGSAKLVCIVHASNSLGTINPIKKMINLAHNAGALVLVDAAQSISHIKINVQKLNVDFLAFSGHKIYGPTGIGVLYGKEKLLEKMVPYEGGGDMILNVTFDKTTFNSLPFKFEAGTPNISGAIGLSSAIDYVKSVGFKKIKKIEADLLRYATVNLKKVKGLKIIGPVNLKEKVCVISFILDGIHPHDISTFLNDDGIAIRAGHHCTQPVMEKFGLTSTARISLAFYNSKSEIDKAVRSLNKLVGFFS